nr:RNA-directed DNA polymerase, eukaryota [Tanacetum cinerariifolium]
MQEKLKLSKSQGASKLAEKQRMQNIPYTSAVGSIMYAVRCTRPDVAFAQNMTSQHDKPYSIESNTKDMFLTGYAFVLNRGVVGWKSTKQSIFATSSTDAEYIAAFDASKEAVWIRKFIYGLGIVPTIEEPISIYCDNTGAIAIAKDDGVTKGARHFCAKVHYHRETIKLGDVKIEKIHTDDNLADPRLPRGGCEQNQVNELEDLMRLVVLSPIEDRWMWGLENSGLFSVASIRRHIDDKMLSGWNCKTRWINYVPIKVNVLAWKVMTESLPTRFNISRRGIPIDSILCVNCDMGVETSRHLFFSCRMAKEVTNLIARWWDVPEPECESYEEWLVWVTTVRLPLKNKKLFEGVFYVLWWLLWWFRNKSIFGCNSPKKALFFDDLKCKSFFWCRYRCNKSF